MLIDGKKNYYQTNEENKSNEGLLSDTQRLRK